MAGILDQALLAPDGFNPQSQGILKAAFALMAAGGPTRVPTGIGEALGQAGSAGVDAYEQAKKARVTEALQAIQLKKAANDLALQEQLQNGGALNTSDPDKLEAIGTRLALAGHPGGAGIINAAEKMRAKRQAEARLGSLKSGPAPDPQELEQAADQGTPAPQPQKGLFAPYFSSPFVGDQAKALQARLDAEGPSANPDDYLKRLDALATAHRAAQEKENERLFRESMVGKSEHVIQDKNSPTGWSYEDTRSGRRTVGAPPPNTGAAAGDVIPPQHKDLHGDDYLNTLPTGMGALVKSIAEGKVDISKAASLRYGNREAIQQRVLQYDPTFNQTRSKVYQDFTTGKTAQNVTAMNTVIAHMGTVSELTDALKNNNVQRANALVNRLRTELGKPEINNAQIAIQAMGNELMRVFRQVQASEQETKDWEAKFNAAKGSPTQLKDALKVAGNLLKGRIEAVQDQWDRGVQNDQRAEAGLPKLQFPLLSEKSKQALSRIGIVGKDIPLTTGPTSGNQRVRKYNPATGALE